MQFQLCEYLWVGVCKEWPHNTVSWTALFKMLKICEWMDEIQMEIFLLYIVNVIFSY